MWRALATDVAVSPLATAHGFLWTSQDNLISLIAYFRPHSFHPRCFFVALLRFHSVRLDLSCASCASRPFRLDFARPALASTPFRFPPSRFRRAPLRAHPVLISPCPPLAFPLVSCAMCATSAARFAFRVGARAAFIVVVAVIKTMFIPGCCRDLTRQSSERRAGPKSMNQSM